MEEKKDFRVRKYFTTWIDVVVAGIDEDEANYLADNYVANHINELLDNIVENEQDCTIDEI